MTDTELIKSAGGGDRAAFESLYFRHWKAVYSYAWLLTRSVADAEDITQECFLTLIRKAELFDPAGAQLRTWLIAVVRRQYFGRRRNSSRETGGVDLQQVPSAAEFDEDLIRAERAGTVRLAMAALPQAQQEALYLFEFEGLSLSEVAGVLNIEANAVKARLYRAREQLKLLLAPLREGASPAGGNYD
ncbi:MAG TPA: sigma-70 family RNA polymerase sigma factor [Bryobacteraceae bacterium]|nr:sigma-70 family RNA polymerase sigma factor [Bryobacteraceae bacterium]